MRRYALAGSDIPTGAEIASTIDPCFGLDSPTGLDIVASFDGATAVDIPPAVDIRTGHYRSTRPDARADTDAVPDPDH